MSYPAVPAISSGPLIGMTKFVAVLALLLVFFRFVFRCGSSVLPVTHMRCRRTDSFLATATTARRLAIMPHPAAIASETRAKELDRASNMVHQLRSGREQAITELDKPLVDASMTSAVIGALDPGG